MRACAILRLQALRHGYEGSVRGQNPCVNRESEPSKTPGVHRGGRVSDGMGGRSQACRATAQGRADSLAHRSGRSHTRVWRVSRATDVPLLGTRRAQRLLPIGALDIPDVICFIRSS
jgi:hypothetical protein